jgi:hypothetical protein
LAEKWSAYVISIVYCVCDLHARACLLKTLLYVIVVDNAFDTDTDIDTCEELVPGLRQSTRTSIRMIVETWDSPAYAFGGMAS